MMMNTKIPINCITLYITKLQINNFIRAYDNIINKTNEKFEYVVEYSAGETLINSWIKIKKKKINVEFALERCVLT